MRSTEAVNARLTRVQAAGVGDTYETGGAPAAGAEKWAGDVGAWYEERRQRQLDGPAANVYVWRDLIVSADLGIPFEEGDVLTFARAGQAAQTGTVQAVEADAPPPGHGGDVRLTLERL